MSDDLNLLGISGSLRRGSYNTSLLETIKTLLPPGMTLEIVTPIAIPVYNGDDEDQTEHAEEDCERREPAGAGVAAP